MANFKPGQEVVLIKTLTAEDGTTVPKGNYIIQGRGYDDGAHCFSCRQNDWWKLSGFDGVSICQCCLRPVDYSTSATSEILEKFKPQPEKADLPIKEPKPELV